VKKIGYIFKFLAQQVNNHFLVTSVYDDAGTTVDQKSQVSDDAQPSPVVSMELVRNGD